MVDARAESGSRVSAWRVHIGINRQFAEESGQFLRIGRLGQVRVEARPSGLVAVLLLPEPGERDDDHTASELTTDPATDFMAVETGHADIEQHNLGSAKPTIVKPGAARAWLEVPVYRAVTTIGIKITQVAKGAMNESCLSGVMLVRGGSAIVPLRGVDDEAATSLPRALIAMQTALSIDKRPGLEKLLKFPFVYHYSGGFFFNAPPAVKHASW